MRVAVYHSNDDIRVEEQAKPAAGPGEILMQVQASGICGSDVMEWYRLPKAPIVLGHEVAGDVTEIGEGVQSVAVGDRIVVSHHVPCDSCHLCDSGHHTACETLHTTNFAPGGFSEFVRVPGLQTEKGVLALPDHVTYEEGTFVEPLGCVVRAQERAGVRTGLTVLVLGAGISGLLHIRLALAEGAGKVLATDVSESRLRAAKDSGAAEAWGARNLTPEELVERVQAANGGRLADLVLLCTGAVPAIHQGLACLEPGGTFVFFAPPPPGEDVPLPMLDLWRKDVTIATSYGAAPHDLERALNLIASASVRVDDLVTHRLPLEEAAEGFRLVAEADESIKVIIEPGVVPT